MRRLFGSVRARATVAATLVVAVVLVAAGTAVVLSLRANLIDRAGADAESAARKVAARLATGTSWNALDLPDDDDEPVQIVDGTGRVRAVSEDLESVSGTGTSGVRPSAGPAPAGGTLDDDAHLSSGEAVIDGDRGTYRWAAIEVKPRESEDDSDTGSSGGDSEAQAETDDDSDSGTGSEAEPGGDDDARTFTVFAGAPLDAADSAVRTALTVMLIGLPVLLAVVAAVTWAVTRRALRPVEGIRAELDAITGSRDLARRVPEPATHDEIAALARTTNATLAALQDAVDKQRRFVADASHELRSPIASLRTQLEVGAEHPEFLDLDGAVEDTVRLQHLAADLLLLARLDAGERPPDRPVRLADLVAREAAEHGLRARIEPERADGYEVRGSAPQLGRILGNLLDNARRHARTEVALALRQEGADAVVTVSDDGPGVPPAERDRVFERFVRLDDARTRDEGGAGLGLAIARDAAHRHGGSLAAGERPGGGAEFVLRVPLSG
ncbi:MULTISPECIES: HAMP domain-containing sensor histidine kinase [unclassified Streptomyces]|uniref:sensor histidine kinase n=1 Tax=unclassified Streptomyces TaxID=2593676 RepID=UPI00081D590E|nr:HAMP domain-containing sensor histidine kinase [Streptomyces sp. LcepLS]MYR27110.1 two-component sensor histidine kinase [Streptomyces sp. SID4945]SCF18068.1 Signal transduction histidine kinase [Streptomyces sp. LcepLS]